MSKPITKLLKRWQAFCADAENLIKEMREMDAELRPRLEQLAAAFEFEKPSTNLPPPAPPLQTMARTWSVPAPVKAKQKRGSRMAPALSAVLARADRPLSTQEVLDALLEAKVPVNGKRQLNTVSAHLSHYSDLFAKTPDGWTLRQTSLGSERANTRTVQ